MSTTCMNSKSSLSVRTHVRLTLRPSVRVVIIPRKVPMQVHIKFTSHMQSTALLSQRGPTVRHNGSLLHNGDGLKKSVFAHTHVYYVVRVARGRWFVGGSDAWNVSVTAQACSQEKRYDLKLTVYIMLYDTVYFQEARLQHEHVQTYITWSEHLKTYTFYNLIIFP